jgi:hypothetical protein
MYTWYDNPGMQALLEIEKALIRKKEGSWTHYCGDIGTGDIDRLCCGLHNSADNLAKNTTLILNIPENISSKIESQLDALESVVTMTGDEVQALKSWASLRCHASFQWICITSKPYNDSHW